MLKIQNESGIKFEVKTAWNSTKQKVTKEWVMSMYPEMATLVEQVKLQYDEFSVFSQIKLLICFTNMA